MTAVPTLLFDHASQSLFDQLNEMVIKSQYDGLVELLTHAKATDVASVLRSFNTEQRVQLWQALTVQSPSQSAAFLDHLVEAERVDLIRSMATEYTKKILPFVGSFERRQLLSQLPAKQQAQLISTIPQSWRSEEREAMGFDLNSTAGICKTEVIKLESFASVADLELVLADNEHFLDHLEWRYAYLYNDEDQYVGVVKTRDIFRLDSNELLIDHLDASVPVVKAAMDLLTLKPVLDATSHAVIPVIDDAGFQIGVVGAKQLNEVLYQQSEQQMLESSGIFGGDEYRNMSLNGRYIRRLLFLLPSVVLSYAAVSIIAAFEPTIEQLAVLAAMLPLVANLSGAAGNQSVAVSIRELSTGHIGPKDLLYVAMKELPIGAINGLVVGFIIALLALFTQTDDGLGLAIIVGGAYSVSSVFAVLIGGLLPLMLKRFNLDPAMLSSPILTTLTDAFSFFTVLYLVQTLLL